MTLAERRHHMATAKSKAKRHLQQWKAPITPASVGRAATTRCMCNCEGCSVKFVRYTRAADNDERKIHGTEE